MHQLLITFVPARLVSARKSEKLSAELRATKYASGFDVREGDIANSYLTNSLLTEIHD